MSIQYSSSVSIYTIQPVPRHLIRPHSTQKGKTAFYIKWRKNTLIGAHYAPQTHTFKKLMNPAHSGQFKPPWMMMAKKGPPLRQAAPRRASRIFKRHSCFTAFPSFPLWMLSKLWLWHDGVCYADAGQTLFKTLRPWRSAFLSVILKWKNSGVKMLLQALVSPDVFMYLQSPSG